MPPVTCAYYSISGLSDRINGRHLPAPARATSSLMLKSSSPATDLPKALFDLGVSISDIVLNTTVSMRQFIESVRPLFEAQRWERVGRAPIFRNPSRSDFLSLMATVRRKHMKTRSCGDFYAFGKVMC
jgi:hypothetical protein